MAGENNKKGKQEKKTKVTKLIEEFLESGERGRSGKQLCGIHKNQDKASNRFLNSSRREILQTLLRKDEGSGRDEWCCINRVI